MRALTIVTFATTYPRWSGDSEPSFIHHLNRHLVERGHRVRAIVPHAPGAATRETLDGVDIQRFRYAPEALESVFYEGGVLPKLRASWRARVALPAALASLYARVRREIASTDADLVHAHWLVPQGSMAVGPAARRQIPLVISAHGADVHQIGRTPLRRLAAYSVEHADAITANTRDTADHVEQLARPRRLDVIPMGTDLGMFGPQRRDGELRKRLGITGPWILGVGRLVEKKGFRYLVEAMATVAPRYPGLVLTIAGDGPLRGELQQQATSLGLGTTVRFLGPLSPTDVATHMASADLFVGPSVVDAFGDTEAQGVVFVEAMASGCPVISTTVGGIPDVIIDGEHGRLVPPRDASALAAAIAELLDAPDSARRRAEAGLARARRYEWSTIAGQFESLYADLLRATSA